MDFMTIVELDDKRLCGIRPAKGQYFELLLGAREDGADDAYRYTNPFDAVDGLASAASGKPVNDGWVHHPQSGRRRDPETRFEWVEP